MTVNYFLKEKQHYIISSLNSIDIIFYIQLRYSKEKNLKEMVF